MMKFSVHRKINRMPYATASFILFTFAVIITVCICLFAADVVRQGGYFALVFLVFLAAVYLTGGMFFVCLGFSKVLLDASGVTVCFGKIKLNKIKWANVKRIETVRVNNSVSVINVLSVDEPSFSFKKNFFVDNLNKKRISFEFDAAALEIVKEHYDGKECRVES